METGNSNNGFGITYDDPYEDPFLEVFSFLETGQPKSPNNQDLCLTDPTLDQFGGLKKDESLIYPLQNAVPSANVEISTQNDIPHLYATSDLVISTVPGNVNVAVNEPFQQATMQLADIESAIVSQVPSSQEPTAASKTDKPKYMWQRTEKCDNPEDEKKRLNAIKARKNRVKDKDKISDLQAAIKERDQLIAQQKTELEKVNLELSQEQMENKMLRTCLNVPQHGMLRLVTLTTLPSFANQPGRYLALSVDGRKIRGLYKVNPACAVSVNSDNAGTAKPGQMKLQNPISVATGVASSSHMINQAVSYTLPMASGSAVVETRPSTVAGHTTQIPAVASATQSHVILQGNQSALNIPTKFVKIVTGNSEVLQFLQSQ